MVLLVEANGGVDLDDPAIATAGAELTQALADEPEVASAVSYWSLGGAPELRSDAGTSALVVVDVDGDDETVGDLSDRYGGAQGPITVGVGGEDAIDNDRGAARFRPGPGGDPGNTGHARPAGARLWWRGGRLPPLAMAFVSVTGTLLALFAVAQVTDVSIYSINLTTALGLGLAIDYSLFIVSRFRGGAGRRPIQRRRRRAHGRDGRPHGRLLGPHRRRLAVGAARVPAVLPAVVRLRRHRRRPQCRRRRPPHPAGPPGRARVPVNAWSFRRHATVPGGAGGGGTASGIAWQAR